MTLTFSIGSQIWTANLSNGFDLSLGVAPIGPKAWYVDAPHIAPVTNEQLIGSVAQGGSVNFYDVTFNPHGHGTHTECLGHITKEKQSVNQLFNQWFLPAQLISIAPEVLTSDRSEWVRKGDRVITAEQIELVTGTLPVKALIIRTTPNHPQKKQHNYSSTNPPYLLPETIDWLNHFGIEHLLVDIPSVDREADGGLLAAHHRFWKVPESPQAHKTITELIYAPNEIPDGTYLLNLQMAAIENDASPSRPVIFTATPQ